jgi:putative ABC transport system permease protein
MLIIIPGQEKKGMPSSSLVAKKFTNNDVEAIKKEIISIRGAAPVGSTMMRAVYGNQNYSTTIEGSDNDYFIIKDWVFASGRSFSETELRSGKAVCVIGQTIKKELYKDQDPMGTSLRLENFSCEVIGLLEPKGAAMFGMDQDDVIIVPIKMFQRRISGNQDITRIMLSASNGDVIEDAKQSTILLLQERRRIGLNEENDFYVRDMREMLETLSSTTKMLTILLGAVAAISLLVGGIGIMNIMLVSVTERTHEIGIRLAIGALEREVLLQFLVEAVVLSSLGGIIGIFLGLGLGVGAAVLFDLPLIFNIPIITTAFLFSTSVGIVFGYFPAQKAARLNPIDALRHE